MRNAQTSVGTSLTFAAAGERPAVCALPAWLRWLPPALVAISTFALFLGTVNYQFLDWDDVTHIAWNPNYRGLTWGHFSWMVTTIRGGHWIPVTWATFGLDHAMWGMDPFGYHLTNVVLHTTNAVLFFAVAWSLLHRARPASSPATLHAGAAAAAVLFALHPLRAESVAWITERRDVLSALFWLLAVLCYLRAPERAGRKTGWWKLASLLAFMLAVMSKSITVTLPVILLILDMYPLRRMSGGLRRLVLEKISYAPMMLFGTFMALASAYNTGYLTAVERLSFVERVLVVAYSVWFYVKATALPLGLSPLYELPPRIHLTDARFLVPVLIVAAITVSVVLLRRRWPALLAAWAGYLVTLSPVSGALHNGAQIVADRYSYLSCLPFALLFGAGMSLAAERVATPAPGLRRRVAAVVAFAVTILVLTGLTHRQLEVWRNSETLWRYVIAADPDCFICHIQAGKVFRDKPDVAIAHFERAAVLRPDMTRSEPYLVNRGLTYIALHREDSALRDLASLRSVSPRVANALGPLFVTGW